MTPSPCRCWIHNYPELSRSSFHVLGYGYAYDTDTPTYIYICIHIHIFVLHVVYNIYIYSIHRSRYIQLCDILNMLTWFVYLPFTGAIAHKCWTPGSKIPGVGREPTSGCGCRNILAAKTRGFPLLKTRLRMGIQHGDSGEILHEFAVGESLFFFAMFDDRRGIGLVRPRTCYNWTSLTYLMELEWANLL